MSFLKSFFGNEISVTKKEAFEKDSSYWNSARPEPLTAAEQEMVHEQDSIKAVTSTVHYKDSIEARYNRVSFGEVVLHDVGIRDHRKQRQFRFSSIMNTTGFEIIGGYRFIPYITYFKRWGKSKIPMVQSVSWDWCTEPGYSGQWQCLVFV